MAKIAVVDVERSPHVVWTYNLWNTSMRADQIIEPSRIYCFSVKRVENGKASKTVFYAEWQGDDIPLELWNTYDWADVVITFNGKRADTPWSMAEIVEKHPELGPPSPYQEIDLWQQTKRFRFASSTLDYIAQTLLSDEKDRAGYGAWKRALDGDVKAQRGVRRYNIQDVDLTWRLFELVKGWIKMPNLNAFSGPGVPGELRCPKCERADTLKQSGVVALATGGVYQTYRCRNDGGWVRGKTPLYRTQEVGL